MVGACGRWGVSNGASELREREATEGIDGEGGAEQRRVCWGDLG